MDNSIRQCKKCSSYMDYHMDYIFGNVFPYYTCPCCGYDIRSEKSYTTYHITKTNQTVITTNSTLSKE